MTAVADAVREKIRESNRLLVMEAVVEMVMGLLVSVVTFGFIYGFTYVFFGSRWALGVLATYATVTFFAAWRREDPLAGLPEVSETELAIMQAAALNPHFTYFSPRHATAGFAAIILNGPSNILVSVRRWRGRVRADAVTIEAAATVLGTAAQEPTIESLAHPAAGLLLHRLGLIKVVPDGTTARIMLTEKGRAARTA